MVAIGSEQNSFVSTQLPRGGYVVIEPRYTTPKPVDSSQPQVSIKGIYLGRSEDPYFPHLRGVNITLQPPKFILDAEDGTPISFLLYFRYDVSQDKSVEMNGITDWQFEVDASTLLSISYPVITKLIPGTSGFPHLLVIAVYGLLKRSLPKGAAVVLKLTHVKTARSSPPAQWCVFLDAAWQMLYEVVYTTSRTYAPSESPSAPLSSVEGSTDEP